MFRTALFAALALVAGALLAPAFGADAYKGPPTQGAIFAARAIICDTKDQVADISKAGEGGDVDAVRAAYLKWRDVKDANGEATCMDQPVRAIAGESVALGFSTAADGTRVKTWAVHVGTSEAEAWVLYPEAAKGDDALTPQKELDSGAALAPSELCKSASHHDAVNHIRLYWCIEDSETAAPTDCVTFAEVRASNPPDARFAALTGDEFAKVIAHFAEQGNRAPDRVKSIVLGSLAGNDTTVWVFAFDKDKCETASFSFSASAMKAILGG